MTSFNSPPTNTTYKAQAAPWYFLYEWSLFCLNFRCHGNQGRSL